MATDLAEFVGAAVGLNLVFGMPLLIGGVVTLALAFGVLALEQRGYRRYEIAVVALLARHGRGGGGLPVRRRAEGRITARSRGAWCPASAARRPSA